MLVKNDSSSHSWIPAGRSLEHANIWKSTANYLGWIKDGVGKLAGELVSGSLPAALVTTGFELVLAAVGVFLIIVKEDPMIKIPPMH